MGENGGGGGGTSGSGGKHLMSLSPQLVNMCLP